jgi:hypothetical protein
MLAQMGDLQQDLALCGIPRRFRRIGMGHGRHQPAGIGVARIGKDILGLAALHHLAAVHHDDPIRHGRGDLEVVGDHDQSHARLALQVPQEFEDLCLNADVECRSRLIGDQNIRLQRDRHGDHHALPLSARELVRIIVDPLVRFRNSDPFEQPNDLVAHRTALAFPMALEHLGDLPADRIDRVEIGQRVLEDHGDAAAVQFTPAFVIEAGKIGAVEHLRARDDVARRTVDQPHDRPGADALSRSALTEDDEGFAGQTSNETSSTARTGSPSDRKSTVSLSIRSMGLSGAFIAGPFAAIADASAAADRRRSAPSSARMFKESVVSRIASPGQKAIHHAVFR